MNLLSQDLQDVIIDHQQFYGHNFWIFPTLTKSEIKPYTEQGLLPLQCVYLPTINDSLEFAECNNIAVPIIWQGIPGKYEVYEQPSTDSILDLMYDPFHKTLSEPQTRKLYDKDSFNKIMQRLKQYKQNIATRDLRKGYLIRLDPGIVPFAKQYPIARIKKVLKFSSDGLDIEIVHQQSKQGKIMAVRNSGGWIPRNAVTNILSKTTDKKVHFGIFTQQQLLKSRQRNKTLKNDKQTQFEKTMQQYCGKKVKKELKEQNFKKNSKKTRQCIVEQEINSERIDDCLIKTLRKNKIPYKKTKNILSISVETPLQMSKIIGHQNIMNVSNGHSYFLKYPVPITYGYNWVYPRLKIEFDVLKANTTNNIER